MFYVANQDRARDFYRSALGSEPVLDVPGMTTFALTKEGASLGLMPEAGIRRLLGETLPDPAQATGVPRSELYLHVEDPEAALVRAEAAGGRLLSTLAARPWGDDAGYVLDLDGHVLVFARPSASDD